MIPCVRATPLDAPFLPELARAWLAAARNTGRDPADGLLILPTKRAARAAAASFLAVNGAPLIMPRITALGHADEAALSLTANLELPPAIAPPARRSHLARLILAIGGRDGGPTRLSDALVLADDLALLIDAAAQAEIDLAETLPNIVAPDLATHWQRTLDFLSIITRAWPAILAEQGAVDPAQRIRRSLDAQSAAWSATPPTTPVWLAGLAVATPAVARLARVVAQLPAGMVVLAGYDAAIDDESWKTLSEAPTHPQAGLARLLAAMGVARAEVHPLNQNGSTRRDGRAAFLRAAFQPAVTSDTSTTPPTAIAGLYRLDANDEQDEARAIALTLREALETPGQDAALVTPDRNLAMRVSAELLRLGIRAEDSAGECLTDTPPAILLRLLAAAQSADYAAIPLLSLLKHPLTAIGRSRAECRAIARRLDLLLRETLPGPGFAALLHASSAEKYSRISRLLTDLQKQLEPLIGAVAPRAIPPATLLNALIQAADAITTDDKGASALWDGEAGAALSAHLALQLTALDGLPDIAPAELAPLFDAVLGTARLRRPRARDANPRVAIWGIMEARLQSVDVLVLGGMVEGIFPAEPDPGPWLSRPMRRAAQLTDHATLIGEAAHDVTSLIATCDTVILSAPKRRGRAPAVPSRFLARIALVANSIGATLPHHPAASWAAQLDQPTTRIVRPPPMPRPPSAVRPVTYSISDITTLLADPYAIHARRIMGLRPLGALDAETDTQLFGTIVHQGLGAVATSPNWAEAPDAEALLAASFERALRTPRLRRALEAFWRVRLTRLATWIVDIERARIADFGIADRIAVEISGAWQFPPFTIHGRADRIEQRGSALAIIDYKTGDPPKNDAVASGAAPQLPLEAVIAEAGGFAGFGGLVDTLEYWKTTGGAVEGKLQALFGRDPALLADIINAARITIPHVLAHYADPASAYFDRPHPGRGTYDQPFAGVSRRAEWEDSA